MLLTAAAGAGRLNKEGQANKEDQAKRGTWSLFFFVAVIPLVSNRRLDGAVRCGL